MSAISASGNELTFMVNDTGLFITSGDYSARIISSDHPYKGGVVHVIDRALLVSLFEVSHSLIS